MSTAMKETEFKMVLRTLTFDFLMNHAGIFKSDICENHCYLGFDFVGINTVCIKHMGMSVNIESFKTWLSDVKNEFLETCGD